MIYTKKIILLIKLFFILTANYCYDFFRYIKYSSTFKIKYSQKELLHRIIAHYHVLEKGLSLKKPRPKFGSNLVNSLINLLVEYESSGYDTNNISYRSAISCLEEYAIFNNEKGSVLDNKIYCFLEKNKGITSKEIGGTKIIYKKNICNIKEYSDVVKNRHSIRNFGESQVSEDKILEAISLAQQSPSVCNRQGTKVHIVKDEFIKKKILERQNGNRGFGEKSQYLLVITSDLSIFHGVEERNQCYIDSGLFAMTLMHALVYKNIASCPLNWCVNHTKDKNLRKKSGLKISKDENIIMIIAIGSYPKEFKVAISTRKDIFDIINIT
jgi:nitroreductase